MSLLFHPQYSWFWHWHLFGLWHWHFYLLASIDRGTFTQIALGKLEGILVDHFKFFWKEKQKSNWKFCLEINLLIISKEGCFSKYKVHVWCLSSCSQLNCLKTPHVLCDLLCYRSHVARGKFHQILTQQNESEIFWNKNKMWDIFPIKGFCQAQFKLDENF